jgi:hypothetical protein
MNANNLPSWMIFMLLLALLGWTHFDSMPRAISGAEIREAAIAEGVRLARVEMAKDCWRYKGAESVEEAKKCLGEHVR